MRANLGDPFDISYGLCKLNSSHHNLSTNVSQVLQKCQIVGGVSGASCLLVSLLVVVFLLVFVHKTRLQRLILYYAGMMVVYDGMFVAFVLSQNYDSDGHRINSPTACAVISKLYLYSVMATPDFAAVVTNYMMILFLLLSCNELRIQSTPKWLKICLECVCVAVAFFFPLTYLWLLVEDGFLSGYCSGTVNCDLIYRDLTMMYSIAVAILLETVVATVITLLLYCRVRRSMMMKSKQVDMLVQRTTLLVIFNVLAFGFILVSFVVVIVSGTNLDAAQYVPVTCFVTSLVPVYIEITLVVFLYISVRGSGTHFKCFFQKQRRCEDVKSNRNCRTSPSTHPSNQPTRSTHFDIPYTGGFTQLSNSAGQQENTPLINREKTCCLIS